MGARLQTTPQALWLVQPTPVQTVIGTPIFEGGIDCHNTVIATQFQISPYSFANIGISGVNLDSDVCTALTKYVINGHDGITANITVDSGGGTTTTTFNFEGGILVGVTSP